LRAATVPERRPSEPSPRRDRVPLSRPLTPVQLSTAAPLRTPLGCPAGATRQCLNTTACRSAGSATLSPGSRPVPVCRRTSRDENRPVSTASPTSELCSPCKSVRSTPASRAGGRCSPGLLPLQRPFPCLRTSNPPRPESRDTHPCPKAPAHDSADLTTPERTAQPPQPGETSPNQ